MSVRMMHLTHRNRVDHFADAPRNSLPLRSPLSSGEGLLWQPFTNNRTRRMRPKSPLRWRGGTAAERVLARHEPKREKRLWWVRCIIRSLFHQERNMKEPPAVVYDMWKAKKSPAKAGHIRMIIVILIPIRPNGDRLGFRA